MSDDYTPLDAEGILHNAEIMARRMHFDNLHDEEDAAQDAALAMWQAQLRAEEGRPVRNFQRRSGRCAVLSFYANNKERRDHLHLTLDAPVGDDGNATVRSTVTEADGDSYMDRREATEQDLAVRALVDTLPPEQAFVIRRRYFDGLTLHATGELLGCTNERVRQIQDKAEATLRHRWEHQEA